MKLCLGFDKLNLTSAQAGNIHVSLSLSKRVSLSLSKASLS
jgi:hypothetical protein